jgi:voltage-gated potassium channel
MKTTFKQYLSRSLFPRDSETSTVLERVLSAAILFAVVLTVLDTEPNFQKRYDGWVKPIEFFIFLIFSAEYVLRLILCGNLQKYEGLTGKIKYILSPMALTDLLAILPNILVIMVDDLMFLRLFRLFRMFRIVKLVRTNKPLMLFAESIQSSWPQLSASMVVTLFLLFLSAILLYFVEGSVQPEAFGSIPRAMWWAMATLTTVGYGDVYPITVMGKICAGIISLISIGVVALPAGIIAANFSDKLKK